MTVELNSSLIGKTLDFDTYSPAWLGTRIKGAKLLGILDPATAKVLGFDITALHIQVYPDLPNGTPDSAMKYNYLKFLLSDGTTSVLGIPWIKTDSVTIVQNTVIEVTINGRNHDDIEQVRKALLASGFEDFKITVSS